MCENPHNPGDAEPPPGSIGRVEPTLRRWGNFAFATTFLIVATMLIAGETVARRAEADVARAAQASAVLHAAVLRSELAKHRSLPYVLAQDEAIAGALDQRSAAAFERLNRKLEAVQRGTGVAVIYVLDAEGRTVAASNWRLRTSFVGHDYSFRPYFRDAASRGVAEMFGLGASSRRPGLYLSHRIDTAAGPAGVVVVKAEFDALEAEWSADSPAFAVDGQGTVLITSVPSWRFLRLGNGAAGPGHGAAAPEPAGLAALSGHAPGAPPVALSLALPGEHATRFMAAGERLGAGGWRVYVLTPVGGAVRAAVGAALTVSLLVGVIGGAVAAAILVWRTQASARAARHEAARLELETRVEARTRELRKANRRLSAEMDERRRAESSADLMRERLMQSTKLATLGQIAAGVAHEINQPIAAIRSYADNAAVFLERQDVAAAQGNLALIADLTERVGRITDELRGFGRKSRTPPAPVSVQQALEGALLLLAPRIRQQGVRVAMSPPSADLCVMAERSRFEQVLVNLLQNALEALAGVSDPEIAISVTARGSLVRIAVSDNGPGFSAEAAASVFTPFATTKPLGLGLGLVISRDIAAEFGGDLSLQAPPTEGGARLLITLVRAR